jgi:hypothetical protein
MDLAHCGNIVSCIELFCELLLCLLKEPVSVFEIQPSGLAPKNLFAASNNIEKEIEPSSVKSPPFFHTFGCLCYDRSFMLIG